MPDDQPPSDPHIGRVSGSGIGGSDPAPRLTRQELQNRGGRRRSRVWLYALIALIVVVVAAVVAVAVSSTKTNTATKSPVKATTTTTATPVVAPPCPLTGAPAPGGSVPDRPALGVKIGNYSGDRPSAGLNQADIVFEEPVEGAITRILAVFQCQSAPLVGDLRSAREPDVGILSQLSHPIFAHAGGINPVLALLKAAPLTDVNVLDGSGSVLIKPAGRVAPYSTFTSTAAMWGLYPSDVTPPSPVYQYSSTLPAASVAGSGASVHIPFSSSSDVTWQWNAGTGTYLRLYSNVPDKLLDGSQTSADNVVIMTVHTTSGPWVENSEGGLEVQVTATGSGPLVVMRNGVAITGTWSRSSLTEPATLTAANGSPITLQPGNTWNELVPVGIPVTVSGTPPAAAAASTTTTKAR
jgi:hypothetical protein